MSQQPQWQGGGNGGNRQQEARVAINTSDLSSLAVRSVQTFARRHKIITGSYLLGISILLVFGSGYQLSREQQREYNRIMNTIDVNLEYDASNRYGHAYQAYYATKGWFTCDSLCQRNKRRMEDTKRDLDAIRAEGYQRMSDAKKAAGIFSEIGVGEVKDSFWEYFHAGKRFAKRQSMWDAMFMGIRSMGRDESMVEYLLRVLMQVLINFSMGLIMSLCIFIFGLWSIVRSYQPDPITAMAFFIGASCAAFAFVSSYLFLVYGAAAGGVYGMAKLAETNARIGAGQNQRPRQRVYNRPHYR